MNPTQFPLSEPKTPTTHQSLEPISTNVYPSHYLSLISLSQPHAFLCQRRNSPENAPNPATQHMVPSSQPLIPRGLAFNHFAARIFAIITYFPHSPFCKHSQANEISKSLVLDERNTLDWSWSILPLHSLRARLQRGFQA